MYSNPPPFSYNQINIGNSVITPSTVHVSNTQLSYFFQSYLFSKFKSIFKWTIPENWSRVYFENVLYCFGYISVFNTDKFGIIPQGCGLMGYDVFYQPTKAVIANPLISGIVQPKIGQQCEIIKLKPDYTGILDLIVYYGDLLALCAQALGMNLINSKLAFVFLAKNKSAAESFKKMYDQVMEGNPAVIVDQNLTDANGNLTYHMFSQDLKSNYIADKIIEQMEFIESEFLTEVGISNVAYEKKERLLKDEVNANNEETRANSLLWLRTMKEGCAKVNKMFGLNLNVEFDKGGIADNDSVGKSAITL